MNSLNNITTNSITTNSITTSNITTNSITASCNTSPADQLYRISDAAQILNLKSHVIRNWENELEISTPRSNSGHRYYTQSELDTLIQVKHLKDLGYSLKQIKLLLPNLPSLKNANDATLLSLRNRLNQCKISQELSPAKATYLHANEPSSFAQIAESLKDIVTDAISENIDAISKEISSNISESLSKELNYQLIQHETIINDRLKVLEEKLTNGRKTHKSNNQFLSLRSRLTKRVNSGCHLS